MSAVRLGPVITLMAPPFHAGTAVAMPGLQKDSQLGQRLHERTPPEDRDVARRQEGRGAGAPGAGDQDEAAGLGHGEIGAREADLGVGDETPQRGAGALVADLSRAASDRR